MRERPIIFSGEMVRAILEGRKTMTRRIINPQPVTHDEAENNDLVFMFGKLMKCRPSRGWGKRSAGELNAYDYQCPYGQPGDHLWVRETWYCDDPAVAQDIMSKGLGLYYKATELHPEIFKWKAPLFMPRWASRITLDIEAVRVERAQEISEEDAIREGIKKVVSRISDFLGGWGTKERYGENLVDITAKNAFSRLWESIHGPGSWKMNPWIWVIEFKII